MSDERDIEIHLTERRAQLRAKRQAVVSGAIPASSPPREGREFLGAMRAALDPDSVGPALAKLFMHAVNSRDANLLKTLLPYVLGKPEDQQQSNQENPAMKLLMQAMQVTSTTTIKKGEIVDHENQVLHDEDAAQDRSW